MNDTKTMRHEFERATIYVAGEFDACVRAVRVRKLTVWVGKYAQYASALHAHFVPKGKRRMRGITQSYRPSLVVVDGWDAPTDTPSAYSDWRPSGEVMVKEARHLSFSDEWQNDFDAWLAERDVTIALDYRGHDPHERAVS